MKDEEPDSVSSATPDPDSGPPALRTHFVSFVLFLLMLTPVFLFGSGCNCNCSAYQSSGGERVAPVAVRSATAGQAFLFLDVNVSGVFTPTDDGRIIPDGAAEPAAADLDLLASQGYLGVRVPHAPPTYTVTSIGTGDGPGATFRYFAPPASGVATSVPVTLTRRVELEVALNARFPITDGRSHWEVWWLPDGVPLPMPDGPFRLAGDAPTPFTFEFRADFGADAVDACSGCTYEYVVFDGATLHGPFDGLLVYGNDWGLPRATFGTHCRHFPPEAPIVSSVLLAPGEPYTYTFCLENYDVIGHTFAVEAASEQGWAYTYYTQTVPPFGQVAPPPVLVGPGPFQVNAPPSGEFDPGMLLIYAAATPDFAAGTGVRELLQISAQSNLSPTVHADVLAVGFSSAFDPQDAERRTYLPTITKQ